MSDIWENKGALTATAVVAATDSLNLNAANFFCEAGIADDVVINAALNAAAGGEVVLLEGNYLITANLVVPADTKLCGAGKGTIVTGSGAAGGITQLVELNDRCTLSDMKLILGAGCGTGGARPNVVYATSKTLIWLQDLWIVGDTSVADDGSILRQNGILFTTVTESKIVNCRSEDNDRHGIYLVSSSNNTVTGNTCQGNTSHGIRLFISSNNTITGNTCQGNTENGIYVYTSTTNTITGNTCQGNTLTAIYLYTSADNNTVTGNTCQGNTQNGIQLVDSLNNAIVGNTCQGNGRYGIYLSAVSNNNTITGNTCADSTGAGYSGIRIDTSDQNVITGNQCDDNPLHGIYIYRSSYCTITGNVCVNQDVGDGINVTGDATGDSHYNTLTANICYNNANDGIEIAGGADAVKNIVLGNQLLGNGVNALLDNGVATDVGHNITV